MPRAKHYSPEIRRFLVSVLYHEARGRGLPMTTLANQLLEKALVDSAGWKQAEEAMRMQESPPPYQSS